MITQTIEQLLNALFDANPIVAWVGHDDEPKEKCCLIGARSSEEALSLMKRSGIFQNAQVKRIECGDWYFEENQVPGIDFTTNGSGKALYYHLVTG